MYGTEAVMREVGIDGTSLPCAFFLPQLVGIRSGGHGVEVSGGSEVEEVGALSGVLLVDGRPV